MARILHTSDLHFGRPVATERLDSLQRSILDLNPDAVAVSGDLTQRCSIREFLKAREYLDKIRESAPVIVIPGNHDVRWLGTMARNLGIVGLLGDHAHKFKYSRYRKYISPELNPSLEVPGAIIAACNTAHGISRGSLTRRIRDLGVIGHVNAQDLKEVDAAFSKATPGAARIVMIHHNPIRGSISRRHGLANTERALRAFANLGAELVLCGHDHQDAVHTIEKTAPGLVISTAGTISNRLRKGRPSSFNIVETSQHKLVITSHTWDRDKHCFLPSGERVFRRPKREPQSA